MSAKRSLPTVTGKFGQQLTPALVQIARAVMLLRVLDTIGIDHGEHVRPARVNLTADEPLVLGEEVDHGYSAALASLWPKSSRALEPCNILNLLRLHLQPKREWQPYMLRFGTRQPAGSREPLMEESVAGDALDWNSFLM
jgi:hypothetical protein